MGGNARLLAQLKLLLRTDLRWNISFKIILPFKHRHEFHRVSLEVTGKYFPQWFFPVRAWGLQQEPKELNHIFNPDEHSALGYGGMLDTWPSTSRSLPKHVEDNGYIIINSMGFKLFSQFPLLSSHFDSSVEKKDLDFSLTSTAIQTRGLLWERHEWRCLPLSLSGMAFVIHSICSSVTHKHAAHVEWRETTLENRTKYRCWWCANYFKSKA